MDENESMRGVFGDSSKSSHSNKINQSHVGKNTTTSLNNGIAIEEFWIEQSEHDFNHKNVPPKKTCMEWLKYWKKSPALPDRIIQTNLIDNEVADNSIHTAKYTLFTFIPMNIMEQFSRLPNVYFLLVGFLQMIKEISNSEGKPAIFIPLSIILCVTAIKDAYEDLKRHAYDKEENDKEVLVARNKAFQKGKWRDIRIGNLVKVFEVFSAAKYEKPNAFLYKFEGCMYYESNNHAIHTAPIDMQNFLLRGCSLRQTEFIIGLVAYTGQDSKIMMNSVKARPKASTLQLLMNREIILVFVVQIIVCLLCSFLEHNWQSTNLASIREYIQFEKDVPVPQPNQQHEPGEHHAQSHTFAELILNYGVWMMLFTNFVPISLLMTLDMVKFFQAIKITKDRHMVGKDGVIPLIQSSSLNEELGQVGYIFTDKTGTLTCNQLVFKAFGLEDTVYGLEPLHLSLDEGSDSFEAKERESKKHELFYDKEFEAIMHEPPSREREEIEEFLLFLAICHEIIAEKQPDGSISYNACSPDDLCLVEFAKQQGVHFLGIDGDDILSILLYNSPNQSVKRYKILNILPFSSARKRMSVIFQELVDEEDKEGNKLVRQESLIEPPIRMFTKGADSIILDRLANRQNTKVILKTEENLVDFARNGYRTLVLGQREISSEFYKSWNNRLHSALSLLNDREATVNQVHEEIENNLLLVGCTAIEDKLQDAVPHTITMLRKAGIQIWMLTGDKRETAINVGLLSSIIAADDMRVTLDFTTQNPSDIFEILASAQKTVNEGISQGRRIALIVTGMALDLMSHAATEQESDSFLTLFMVLAYYSHSLIVCRVSPKQKRHIVDLFRKKNPAATTLAIGDGANDVNMIIGAHVGVGIRGLEGQQAARASDFAIGQFQHVGRLILFYGREFYRRNSNLVLYNFYKNILLVMPQFWYGFYNGFSGQFLYDLWIFQLYNILFTSVPIVVHALFDKQYKASFLMNHPRPAYHLGLLNRNFDKRTFWRWFAIALVQSFVIGYCSVRILEFGLANPDTYITLVGNFMYSNVIIISNLKILLFSKSISALLLISILVSIASYFLSFFVLSQFKLLESFHVFSRLYSSTEVIIGHLFIVCTALLIDVAFSSLEYLIDGNDSISNQNDMAATLKTVVTPIQTENNLTLRLLPESSPQVLEMREIRSSKHSLSFRIPANRASLTPSMRQQQQQQTLQASNTSLRRQRTSLSNKFQM